MKTKNTLTVRFKIFTDSKCSKEVMVRLLDMVAIKQESLAGKYTKAGTSGGKPYWVKGNWAIWARKGR